MQAQLNIAANAALKSGKILMQYFSQRERLRYSKGKEGALTTSAHTSLEEIILDELSKNYPDYGIFAKESGSLDGNESTWYVNAIDGTENFINGLPYFCINISLVVNNEVKLGVIYDATRDELFCAIKGKGVTLNQSRVRIFKKPSLISLIGCKSVNLCKTDNYRVSGCASLDLAYVADNRLAGFISNQNDWTLNAGILMVKEAGGFILNDKNHDASNKDTTIKVGAYKLAVTL